MVVALLVNAVFGAHLGNTYIPPPAHAGTAGGSAFLQTPNRGGGPSHTSHFSSGSSNFGGSGGGFGASAGQFASAGHQGGGGGQGGGYFQPQQQYNQQSSYQHQSSGQQIPILRYDNSPNAGDGSYSYA